MKALVVDKEALRENLRIIRETIGDVKIYGVLKANGYGLGLVEFFHFLKDEGIKDFAVATVEEGVALRRAHVEDEILVLSSTAILSEATELVEHDLTASIGSSDGAIVLSGVAGERKKTVKAHIKIDTGFGRFGFLPEETDKILYIREYMKNIELEGIFSHFSSSFLKSGETTRRQLQKFTGVLERLFDAGASFPVRHIANSSAALRFPETRLDAVRIGSAFLGRLSFPNRYSLLKIGVLKAKVSETKWLPSGHNVGYAEVYKTSAPTKIAVVNLGYSDGFGVEKSKDAFRTRDILRYAAKDLSKFVVDDGIYVEIGGKRCPVLGRVGACSIVVDVTKADCNPGDMAYAEVNPLLVDSLVEREYV